MSEFSIGLRSKHNKNEAELIMYPMDFKCLKQMWLNAYLQSTLPFSLTFVILLEISVCSAQNKTNKKIQTCDSVSWSWGQVMWHRTPQWNVSRSQAQVFDNHNYFPGITLPSPLYSSQEFMNSVSRAVPQELSGNLKKKLREFQRPLFWTLKMWN